MRPGMAERIAKAANDFDAALADDLNTAMALGAAYDLVREVNIAMDKGEFRQGDVAAAKDFLAKFDRVFAVIADTDAEKLAALGYGAGDGAMSDARRRKDGRGAAGCAEAAGLCGVGSDPQRACRAWYNS